MPADAALCRAFWAGFVVSLPAGDPRAAAQPDAFGFGGEGELADTLAALVLAGRKRATASLADWQRAHRWYFGEVCKRLGGALDDATPVLCQCFRVVWPPAARDPVPT